MRFKNEEDFLEHTFHKDAEMIVNAIELQNRLRSINAKDREIEKLNKLLLDLTLKNGFLSARLEEEKMKKEGLYSLDLSA